MKHISSLLSVMVIFLLTLFYGCGDPVPSSLNLQQKAAKILDEGDTWGGTGNVDVLASPSGVVATDLENLQVTFDSSGEEDWAPTFFEVSGAEDYLSTADNATWTWIGSGTNNIELTEASVAELTSVDVTDESVTFTFEVSSQGSGGRVSGIDGAYTVRLR